MSVHAALKGVLIKCCSKTCQLEVVYSISVCRLYLIWLFVLFVFRRFQFSFNHRCIAFILIICIFALFYMSVHCQ